MNSKEFKYIKNITPTEGTILLYEQIGDYIDENGNYCCGISGSGFASEMQYLQTCCSSISVRINSIGGNVIDGYSIISAILNSKVPCNTYIDGLAASIAGVIAMAGKKCSIMDYGTLMMHNPSGGENKDVLNLVKSTLVTILSNRTSKTAEEISAMMDVETWLNATECKEMGIVDEIISSNKKIKMPKMSNLSDLALVYNKIINPKKENMIKITNKLGLDENATEESIVSEIEKKDIEIDSLKAENDNLKKVIEDAEELEKLAKEQALKDLTDKATQMVETAIVEKKIDESEKDATISMAVNNFELVANMISKINNIKEAVKVFNTATVKNEDEKSDWTIRDYEKKDPKGLELIRNENPEKYTQMYNDFYKK